MWFLKPLIFGIAFIVVVSVMFWDDRKSLFGGLSRWLRCKFSKEGIDRTISGGTGKQLSFLLFLIFISLIIFMLVSLIFQVTFNESSGFWGRLGKVYCHFLDPGELSRENTPGGIILAFLITLSGSVLMSGVLISTISNIIDRRVDHIKSGQVVYDFSDHIVIIGFDKMTIGLIRQLAKDKTCRFLIQTIQDVPAIRHELLSHLDEDIDKRVTIIHGGRNSEEDLRNLQISCLRKKTGWRSRLKQSGLNAVLTSCQTIFVLGEKDEADHDSLNVECVKKIAAIRKDQIREAVCESDVSLKSDVIPLLLNATAKDRAVADKSLNLRFPLLKMACQLIDRYNSCVDRPTRTAEDRNELETLSGLYSLLDGETMVSPDDYVNVLPGLMADIRDILRTGKDSVSGLILAEQDRLLSEYMTVALPLLRCNVLIEYQSTFALFQGKKMHEQICRYVDFVPFNFYEMWAQKVLVGGDYSLQDGGKVNYLPLDREVMTDKYVHFVVVGASRMGVALMTEASRIAHFANYKNHKTRITLIDEHACEEAAILKSRYAAFFRSVNVYYNGETTPHAGSGQLGSYLDIEFHFLEGRIESDLIREKLTAWATDPRQLLTIAICLNQPPVSLATGIYLPDAIYRHKIPVLIRQEVSCSTLTSLESSANDRFAHVRPFGMIDDCYDVDLNNDIIPRLVHYIYSNFGCFETKNPTEQELAACWNDIDVIHKWSNRYHADTIPVKLRAVGYTNITRYDIGDFKKIDWTGFEKHVELLAPIEHNRWNIERLLAGFDVLSEKARQELVSRFGSDKREIIEDMYHLKELKNEHFLNQETSELKVRIKAVKKMVESAYYHDCIVPFEELSIADQNSDRVISKGIPWIANRLLQIGGI